MGERLLLTCVFTDVRGGLYRLEEAARQGLASATATDEGLAYLGGEAAGEDEEEEGGADGVGLEGAELTVAVHV